MGVSSFPGRFTTAKLGGRLLAVSEPATAFAIDKLREATAAEFDTTMGGVNFSALTIPSLRKALDTLAASVDERMTDIPKTATL